MNKKSIPVYAINLKLRIDRREFIVSQFIGKEEFQLCLVEAHKHTIGAIGLWITIRHILKNLVNPKDEYIILCEDDHLFTREYSKEYLLHCIQEVQSLHADILACGISGFTNVIKVNENLYWVEKFSGLQFTVIFRKFFQKILDGNFETIDAADLKLCELTENKFFIYPFLSIQKEFGYSDVTEANNAPGHVYNAFKDCKEKIKIINSISSFYKQKLTITELLKSAVGLESTVIPTYIIHLNEKVGYLANIQKQFAGKKEFDVENMEARSNNIKELSFWLSLKKIVKKAIENDDDIIIVCRDSHQFAEHYQGNQFINLVWQAGLLGCNVLLGGMEAFNLALPITDSIFWIDSFRSSKFFVIYKPFYAKILEQPFRDTDTLESKFSETTSSKMTLHPFISKDNEFGVNGINNRNDLSKVIVQQPINANERIAKIKDTWNRFNIKQAKILSGQNLNKVSTA